MQACYHWIKRTVEIRLLVMWQEEGDENTKTCDSQGYKDNEVRRIMVCVCRQKGKKP